MTYGSQNFCFTRKKDNNTKEKTDTATAPSGNNSLSTHKVPNKDTTTVAKVSSF
jgi:hypothetical protein